MGIGIFDGEKSGTRSSGYCGDLPEMWRSEHQLRKRPGWCARTRKERKQCRRVPDVFCNLYDEIGSGKLTLIEDVTEKYPK